MVGFYRDADLFPSPFIFDNGCGIGWPLDTLPACLHGWVVMRNGAFAAVLLGSAIAEAQAILKEARQRDGFQFTLLVEMDSESHHQLTGLTPEQAALATQRLGTLPFRW